MIDLHEIFTTFKKEFPGVHAKNEELGKEIHAVSSLLPEKVRWLIKVAVSSASHHPLALETHIARAREVGATDEEIQQTLLLVLQTVGFPTFMESYSVFKNMK